MDIIEGLKARAKAKQGTVVLPESGDERTLRAAEQLIREEIAKVILVGDPSTVAAKSRELGITDAGWQVTNPNTFARIDEFATWLYGKRKDKGLSREEANALVRNELYFGALLVKFGIADGMVAGAANTTADVLRAGLQVVGVMPGLKTVSSTFIMVVPDYMGVQKVFFFADCAVVPNPTAEQLADIAASTASTRRGIMGDEPRVALLSFSTLGSAKHELVDKVLEAKAILDARKVDFAYDGELQLDAAIVPKVAASKAPQSQVAGSANTLIFPDLQSGNIGYKLVQRLAKAEAIGPIIQGLAAPVCDLSRGCSFEDITNTAVLVLLMVNK
jgi:phosphate acetyltransferase